MAQVIGGSGSGSRRFSSRQGALIIVQIAFTLVVCVFRPILNTDSDPS
jgi:hypothetical protein